MGVAWHLLHRVTCKSHDYELGQFLAAVKRKNRLRYDCTKSRWKWRERADLATYSAVSRSGEMLCATCGISQGGSLEYRLCRIWRRANQHLTDSHRGDRLG